jgi:hypothetical protein
MYILYLYELNIVLGPKQEIATASEDIASHKHCHGPVFDQQRWHITSLHSTLGLLSYTQFYCRLALDIWTFSKN